LLHTAPGEGTAFRLILKPLPVPPKAESASTAAAPAGAEYSIEGLHILLAEDHRELHLALRKLLERSGATVESAYEGREAVARALSGTFDVVLMDLRMPHMNGLEAARALRSQGCLLPIVALTADPATLHREEALDAGCDACLSKPFKLEDLMASIRLSSRPSSAAAQADAARQTPG
jgi:CheY-like chemotaxis protein